MKILLYSDVHWNTNSSLVRARGTKFSLRLEHLIDSLNWINKVAVEAGCSAMICAGDFMDKPQLTDEELTALRQIQWNDLTCYFLCGNHESSVNDLRFSTLKALETSDHKIIDKLYLLKTEDCDFLFIPYIVESDRQSLVEYIKAAELEYSSKPLIIIAHGDIAGINYAGFESKLGFTITEIENNCNLYLNGHLHNSEWVTDKILNLGSCSAHNFTNDSNNYKYGVWILDTTTREIQFIENPYGFNFYKLDIFEETDLTQLDTLHNNAVLSIRCNSQLLAKVKQKLETNEIHSKVIEERITLVRTGVETEPDCTITDLQSADPLGKFVEFCKLNIANSDILEAELAEICK